MKCAGIRGSFQGILDVNQIVRKSMGQTVIGHIACHIYCAANIVEHDLHHDMASCARVSCSQRYGHKSVAPHHPTVWSATSRRPPCAPRPRTQPQQKTEPVKRSGACSDSGGATRGDWCRVKMPMASNCLPAPLPKEVETTLILFHCSPPVAAVGAPIIAKEKMPHGALGAMRPSWAPEEASFSSVTPGRPEETTAIIRVLRATAPSSISWPPRLSMSLLDEIPSRRLAVVNVRQTQSFDCDET